MNEQEVRGELEELRQRLSELYPQIQRLRDELRPLRKEYGELAIRRLELEEKLVKVQRLPYAGPKTKRQRAGKSLMAALRALSTSEKRQLVKALEGGLAI